MSPINKSPLNLTAISVAITAGIVFCALLTVRVAAQTPTKQKTPLTTKPTTDVKKLTQNTNKTSEPQTPPCPEIKVSCPDSIDPGAGLTCSANLSFRAASTVPKYFWSVSSGKITQGQGTSSITVNTTGVTAKQLRVTLRLPQFGKDCAGSFVVTLKRGDGVIVVTPGQDTKPVCPQGKIACPPSVVAGKEISCSINLSGGTKGATPKYSWSVSSGRITQGQGTSAISVSTEDVKEKTSVIRLNLGGFGTPCVDRATVEIQPPPPSPITPTPPPITPTPPPITPTPPPITPTPPPITPTPPPITPTPTGGGIVTISPSPPDEVSPEPIVSPTSTNLWAWILAGLAALVALAAAAFFGMRYLFPGGLFSGGVHKDTPEWLGGGDTNVADTEQRLDALIAGAQRKQEDDVSCTVFAPHEAGRGDGFLVQAFAHLPEQASMLEDIAKQADQAAADRGSEDLGPIERGEELGFYLQMPGLDIDEPQQSVIWVGAITSAKFGVTVPENFKPRSVNCKLSVSRQNVPIGHVRFNFKISDAPQPAEKPAPPEAHPDFVRYKLAFISYASADRSEVMKRVQMLDLVKIKYFQDLLSLEAGKQWEPLIYRYIDECDVFCLFWSSAAKKSKWVEKEVQRALQRKGDKLETPPEILPIPIEGPPPVEPPPYLAAIHFDSKFLYVINSKVRVADD